MALYVPAAKRRRRTLVFVGIAVIIGLVLGALVGRLTAPSVDDRINAVRKDARETASGLRVIAIHDESGAVSNQSASGSGTELVLKDTRDQLRDEFDRAPWITTPQRDALMQQLEDLATRTDRRTEAFGAAADALAQKIEETFGAPT
jgi:hypothetical protein